MAISFDTQGSDRVSISHELLNQHEVKGIPSSLLRTIDKVFSIGAGVTLLIRHAERPPIPAQGEDNVLLSEKGKEAAYLLGKILRERSYVKLTTSPKERCIETLSAICSGANWLTDEIEEDPFFSPSGPFMIDLDLAVEECKRLGGPMLFNLQITESNPVPGMRSTQDGVKDFLQKVFSRNLAPGEINIIVTHDAVTTVLLGYLFGCEFDENNWPDFLDGAFFWDDGLSYKIAWREEIRDIPKI